MKIRFPPLAGLLLAFVGTPAPAQGEPTLTILRAVPYDTAHSQQALDLYHPGPHADAPAPVVIFRYGGWSGNIPELLVRPMEHPLFGPLFEQGFAVVFPGLRPAEQFPFPAPLLDAMRAVQFVRSKAAAWNLDPERVFFFGRSAGASFAAEVTYGPDIQQALASDPVSTYSSRPNGCVLMSGTYDFTAFEGSKNAHYFGPNQTFATVPAEQLLWASPAFWLALDPSVPRPGYLIYHGEPGTPPLTGGHDAWHGFELRQTLERQGGLVAWIHAVDLTEEELDYGAIVKWLAALP